MGSGHQKPIEFRSMVEMIGYITYHRSDVATYSRRTIRKVEKYIKAYLSLYSHRKRRKEILRKDL